MPFNTPFNTPLNAWLSQDPQLCVTPTYLFPCIWKPCTRLLPLHCPPSMRIYGAQLPR
nr:MAG TPA: hypothetical protein [Caudoviricetes sp.]